MWLLNTTTLRLHWFSIEPSEPYAILSHLWGPDEVLFHELQDELPGFKDKTGWRKITGFCEKAHENGFDYGWVDTCCIDKRNSADLSEAINSMFLYYRNSSACFIYLEDVQWASECGEDTCPSKGQRDAQLEAMAKSRWFSRGWTLQELIAPRRRLFLTAGWQTITYGFDLLQTLSGVTRIPRAILKHLDIVSLYSVAERMSWAARRKTTRPEDMVYSLMGLFDVSMPILYGEGVRKAFRRLQLEIMQTSFDMTIFAWSAGYQESGLLAHSPADFADIPPLELSILGDVGMTLSPFWMMNVGLSIRLMVITQDQIATLKQIAPPGVDEIVVAIHCTSRGEKHVLLIYLKTYTFADFIVNGKSCKAYRRVRCAEWMLIPSDNFSKCPYMDLLVLEDEQSELLTRNHFRRMLSRHR
jgi:hypothetical protein